MARRIGSVGLLFGLPRVCAPGCIDLGPSLGYPAARSPSASSSRASPTSARAPSCSTSTTRRSTPASPSCSPRGIWRSATRAKFREDRAFWTLINDSLDARFSKPKRIARELIAFHQARGDTIVFVTSRFPSEPASDRTSLLLQRLFAFPSPPKVLFTAQQPKTEAIRSVHPALSYGDSDGDIADTHEADPSIRAIRIIRSPVSYNGRPCSPGRYGEEILANSAD